MIEFLDSRLSRRYAFTDSKIAATIGIRMMSTVSKNNDAIPLNDTRNFELAGLREIVCLDMVCSSFKVYNFIVPFVIIKINVQN